jgi:5-methylcytosine-specific restriction endonuclease McrA
MTETKTCRTCGKTKPITTFSLNGHSRTRRSRCRACGKAQSRRNKGRRSAAEIRATAAVRKLERGAARALLPPKPKYVSRYAPLVARLLRDDASAASLSKDSQEYRARYRYDEMFRAKEIARREMQKRPVHQDGSLTPRVLARLFASSVHCPYCRRRMRSEDKSLDHIVPRSKGGQHSILNVCVCCRSCNAKKSAKIPEQLSICAA